MTAVIYARYSSDNQREESIEGQIRECTAYAEKNAYAVIAQSVERILGKDEVGSSNLPNSSIAKPTARWLLWAFYIGA